MTTHSRLGTVPSWMRMACALAVAMGSFVALRQHFHGYCAGLDFGYADWVLFVLLPVTFLVGVIWLTSEIVSAVWRAKVSFRAAISVGLSFYLTVGAVVWTINPRTDDDVAASRSDRAWLATFWSLGFLYETGNFNTSTCGA